MTESRPKLTILLTQSELKQLEHAVVESGALSRSLFVQEALQFGLGQSNLKISPQKRKPVDVRIPRELATKIRKLAKANRITEQNTIRDLLQQYIEAHPWKETNTDDRPAPQSREGYVYPVQPGMLIWSAMKHEDLPEYNRIKSEIVKVLDRIRGYEPAVDELYVDQIATAIIYSKNIEAFLDAKTATADTYSKVADTKMKLWTIAENAMRELALSRRFRINNQTQAELADRLKEAMLRGLESGDK